MHMCAQIGTTEGTMLFKELTAYPRNFAEFQGNMFFSTSNGMYISDGTPEGTVEFYDKFASFFTPFDNDTMFFRSFRSTPASGFELFVTDGTPNGTRLFIDLVPGSGSSSPQDLAVANGLLFFKADDSSGFGEELWVVNPLTNTTYQVADIRNGSDGSTINYITPYKDHVYFSADDGIHGNELWRSNGTESGTMLFLDLVPGPDIGLPVFFSEIGGFLYFRGRHSTTYSFQHVIYRTDGTVEGTIMIVGVTGSAESALIEIQGGLYLAYWTVATGSELSRMDGCGDNFFFFFV